MSRQEEEQFEQDNLGNSRRKLDTLRAQEGMKGSDTDEGIVHVGTAETSSDLLAYSLPTHADDVYVSSIHAYNSQASGTFSLYEADLDSNGSITSTTRRSVPFNVGSATTSTFDYEGEAFSKAIAINSEFGGYVGIGLVVDHKEELTDLTQ